MPYKQKKTAGRRRAQANPGAPQASVLGEPRDTISSKLERPIASDDERPEDRGSSAMLDEMAETAPGVLARAMSFLEAKIAAGIGAAEKIESRFIDVDAIRTGETGAVLPRYRPHVLKVANIMVDVAIVASNAAGRITRSVVKNSAKATGGLANGRPASALTSMATVSPASPVRAGATAEMSMVLENAGTTSTEEIAFVATDLVNRDGHRISAGQIGYQPSTLVIAPHDSKRLTIRIDVPEGTASGVYTGLLQTTKQSLPCAMLLVPVE